MTQLSESTIKLILEAAMLANKLGVEGIIFDEAGIRGYNNDEGVIVASYEDYGFEFDKLALTRLSSLMNKATLLAKCETLKVSIVPKAKAPDVIEKLEFDGGKMSFDFRCALPQAIQDLPKQPVINPLFYFDITQEDVSNISKGLSAMRSKHMTIQGNGSDVNFRFSDDAGDILNFEIDGDLESKGEDDSVSLTINIKKMLPIFKIAVQGGDFRLNILKNNILYIAVGNMDVLVMPEV